MNHETEELVSELEALCDHPKGLYKKGRMFLVVDEDDHDYYIKILGEEFPISKKNKKFKLWKLPPVSF